MSDKRCELCGKHPPSVRYTEIDESRVTKRFICRSCAQARGLLDEPAKPVVALQELLAMPAPAAPSEPAPSAESNVACSGCGLTFAVFRKHGRLGCAQCYGTFERQLVPLLRKLHEQVRHAGKAPHLYARKVELRQRVDDLRRELDRAIKSEEYERAAHLRDHLREVELEQSQAARQATHPQAQRSEPAAGEAS